jgi:hypothetical protein
MPLSQSILKREISSAFNNILKIKDKTPIGVIHPQAAEALASAYDNYVISGQPLAGVLKISVPPVRATLVPFLSAPSLAGFVPGLSAYWSPVIWTGPGFIPTNPTIALPSPTLANDILSVLRDSVQLRLSSTDVADRIASLLHTYTTSITVTATTTSVPPVTSTIPIV